MVSANTLAPIAWQCMPTTTVNKGKYSTGYTMIGYQDCFEHAKTDHESSERSDTPVHRQWPWRGFAFCSDLGTVGYLVNKPQLAALGWLLALPYYAYSIFSQPKGKKRNEEMVYQVTANGMMPFAGAKVGTLAGEALYRNAVTQLRKKYPNSQLYRLSLPLYKTLGGLIALFALTPTVGDPLSRWIMQRYQSSTAER